MEFKGDVFRIENGKRLDWLFCVELRLKKMINSAAIHLENALSVRELLCDGSIARSAQSTKRLRRRLGEEECAKQIVVDGLLCMRAQLPCNGEFDVSGIIGDAVRLTLCEVVDRDAFREYVHHVAHCTRQLFHMQRVLLERLKGLRSGTKQPDDDEHTQRA